MSKSFVLAIAMAILVSGCASITRGTSEAFVIESEPTGAQASLSNGMSCTTPCSLKIKRKSEFVVTLTKPGYQTAEANVTNQVAGGGAAGMAGNVLLGGLLGAAIDAGSGAMLELVPNPLVVTLVPAGSGAAPTMQDMAPVADDADAMVEDSAELAADPVEQVNAEPEADMVEPQPAVSQVPAAVAPEDCENWIPDSTGGGTCADLPEL